MYGYTPPDPSHAVGLNHIVTMVNSRIAVYDKAGNQVMAPKNTNTIFAGLPSTDPCRTRNDGDPIAAWDNLNQRFVVSQFTATSPYKQCIAVSQTSDPTGNWWLYSIPLSTTEVGQKGTQNRPERAPAALTSNPRPPTHTNTRQIRVALGLPQGEKAILRSICVLVY